MCGIVGYSHVRRPLPEGVLARGLRSLIHRGPDSQQGFVTRHASVGATRLRIVDVEHGNQPMHNAEHQCTIVFNGEVYNHGEIREDLERRGWDFRTHCDTEVVLNAFLEWGLESFARFRGMFAVGIWNERDRRLTLARDRAGIKPLYYRCQDGEIFFGSELKAIFAHPEVPRRLDLHGLNCYLSLNYVPGPFTLVEGIKKVPAGHALEWCESGIELRSYLPVERQKPAPADLGEACAELDGLLRSAVGEQLHSEVPSGIWLSGGLDSSTITHYAAQISSEPLRTFSVTFRGREFDESNYVRAMAQHYGTNHTEFDLNEDADLADTIAELSFYSDEPSADAGAIPVWYLAKMSRQQVTVALSGEGSDELFGGYLTYKANRLRNSIAWLPRPLLKGALTAAQRLPATDRKIGLDYKLKRFLEGSLLSAEAAHVFWNGTFTELEKQQVSQFARKGPMADLLSTMRGGNAMERFLDFDQRYSLQDALLYKVDRMSMAHSVEVRPPFLDDRIVQFANRLPMKWKLNGLETKRVLRRLMRDALPQSVLQRSKVGLDIPIHAWFRGVLRPLLEDTLTEAWLRESGVFNWPMVRTLMDQHQERKANWGYHLWGLLTLTIWMKRWNVELPAALTSVPSVEEEQVVEDSSSSWQPVSCSVET
ncbi:asparagine synthase (glutamine-hydrolyzing) [Terriglobus albidus]|uniref:asparagine synthase (glutamine-hydrolyzing) n=1 Tax=Terriglobus albidus TaxID=1592106 RepID=UPI0021E073A4|nr:asparagine synthase (glutamine-hydrolyzing) [Terriglobus albidus]